LKKVSIVYPEYGIGEECCYKKAKSHYEIEAVRGKTLISVEQDFWATMTIGNFLASFERNANKELEKEHGKEGYTVKANDNIAIGMLKLEFPFL